MPDFVLKIRCNMEKFNTKILNDRKLAYDILNQNFAVNSIFNETNHSNPLLQ
jgi:hypothetical protein